MPSDLRATDRPMSPEERDDLALAADRSRRGNRPVHLLVFGAAALLIALAVLLASWRSLSSERAGVLRLAGDAAEIERLNADIAAIERAAQNDPTAAAYREIPTILTDIEGLAVRAGLAAKPQVPRRENRPEGESGRRVTYTYSSVADPSLGALLEWVRLVLQDVPGTFVQNIELQPQQSQWRLSVTFARFERSS